MDAYVVIADRAAFEAHLQTPHFFRWRDATRLDHRAAGQLSASAALSGDDHHCELRPGCARPALDENAVDR
jgi:hypothetical protein